MGLDEDSSQENKEGSEEGSKDKWDDPGHQETHINTGNKDTQNRAAGGKRKIPIQTPDEGGGKSKREAQETQGDTQGSRGQTLTHTRYMAPGRHHRATRQQE